jgi:hypothetical protein
LGQKSKLSIEMRVIIAGKLHIDGHFPFTRYRYLGRDSLLAQTISSKNISIKNPSNETAGVKQRSLSTA